MPIFLFFLLISFSYELYAHEPTEDTTTIDNLLEDIKQNTDLSEKTKLENGGISYIYTREDLHRMQVYTLQDVLKTVYPFGYSENKYGVVDPYSTNKSIPYMSSSIKIYIDNQEMTTGVYGSGLSIYGNMDIGFVDHIEVYTGNPTFEFSTEPAFTIIRLYSKSAIRDAGHKVSLVTGTNNEKGIKLYSTEDLKNNWSYFTYISSLDNKRTKYNNSNATLSRDRTDTHIFTTLKKDNHNILVSGILSQRDTFMGGSVFGTPQNTQLDGKYFHIGYDSNINNIYFIASYEHYSNTVDMSEKNKDTILTLNNLYQLNLPYMFHSAVDSDVFTTGVNYKLNIPNHKVVFGVKYRYKYFKYDEYKINDVDIINNPDYALRFAHDRQDTSTMFIENQYSINTNKIITAGISYSVVKNNYSIQDDNLFNYRLGYTYTNNNWISKTVTSYLETTLDPYLINNDSYLVDATKKYAKEKQHIYMQDIKYNINKDTELELLLGYLTIKDGLMPDIANSGLLDNYNKTLDVQSISTRYIKHYNNYSKFEINLLYNDVINMPIINNLKEYSVILKSSILYKQFDFYNELITSKNNYKNGGSYDYSATIVYHYSEDLLFSLKGINLLDKAKDLHYTNLTKTLDSTEVGIPAIDKKILFNIEYTF